MKKYMMIISILLSTGIYAKEYTIDTAVEVALTNNKEIKKENKEIEIKELDYTKSRKLALPKLKYSGNINQLSEETTLLYGVQLLPYKIDNSDLNYSNKLVLEQPIYTGGAIASGIKLLNINKDLEQVKLDQKKREVKLNILVNYLAIVKLQKNQEILENSLKELNETNKNLNESLELDLIQKKPVLDINYRISELKSNIISIKSELDIRKMTLKSLMGVDKNEDITIKNIIIPEVKLADISLESDTQYALENKSTIKSLELSKEMSEANKKIKKADLLPKVNLKANYEMFGETYGTAITAKDNRWNVELTATMTLFDFGMSYDEVTKVKKEIESKDLDEETAKDKIEIGIKNAYSELQRLLEIIDVKKEALISTKENYRIEKDKFDVLLNTSIDLLGAENNLSKVQVELINAQIDAYTSYLKYNDLIEREDI
ncbi:MAG: TolC family protein [Fusobacteriaceae bacterium]|nr:TolC family protein [Fusobacteriaceae bacterium]MBP6466614.1 TolC family protein [Fusobacteriaceae bacterium]MBU9917319.1 TolC family protein [Fusobacteriaceae bacterium]